MTDYSALIERIEAGNGDDGQLNNDIAWEFSEWENMGGWWRRHKVTGKTEQYNYRDGPPVTSSLDAALAFAEGVDVPWRGVLTNALKRSKGDLGRLPRDVLVETLSILQAKAVP